MGALQGNRPASWYIERQAGKHRQCKQEGKLVEKGLKTYERKAREISSCDLR